MRRTIPKSDLSDFPHIVLLTYILLQDYDWKYIFIQMSIIVTILFTNKDHPSRLLLPTFIFGYLLSNYRFYDSLLTILYVYKYQEHHIQIIYSTISILSICKYILMSIYHRNMFLTVGQVILIMCCISYQEILTKIKVDPDFFRSREIKTFRKMSISFSKEKKLLTKSELCTLLNLCWHSCSACYLLCLYLEDSYKM